MSHESILWKAIVLSFIVNYLFITVTHGATLSPKSEGNAALTSSDWGTDEDEEFMPSFLHVKKLFNEGKPFFVEKDPVSGQLDFNQKKSAGVVENYKSPAEELIPLRTNEITPNIHDFLHLPVKYSSSKSVYPLVSTSYASTKYQGSNKDQSGNNHKEYSAVEIQKRPNFFTANAILPFEKTTTTSAPTTSTTTTAAFVDTTQRTTPTVTTFKPSFPRRPSRPIPTRFQEPWKRTEFPQSTTEKFTPTIPTTTTLKTTYSPTIPSTTPVPSTLAPTTRRQESPSPTTFAGTSHQSPSSFFPTTPSTTTTTTTTTPKPTPTTTPQPTTNKPLVFPTETSLSLMEMLNNFADDSNPNANAIQFNENAQPFQRPSGFRPPPHQQPIRTEFFAATTTTTTSSPATRNIPTTTSPRPLITSNPKNNFNEYVKYDIQGPTNMVSFHSHEPVSSMNNIKISPDQNVASFVLGSKQSFGGSDGNDVHLQGVPPGGGPKVVGQVFNEPISGGAVSIRFPSREEENRFENVPVITGGPKPTPNGHSAPFGFDPTKQRVSFPSGSIMSNGQDSQMVGTKIVFESDDQSNSNSIPFPAREVLPLKGNPNQRPIETAEEQGLTPPEPQRNRPPFPQKFGQSQGPKTAQQNRPGLPNILPQFRPNPNPQYAPHHHQYKETAGYRQPYMPNPNRRTYPPAQGSGPIRRNYQVNPGQPLNQSPPQQIRPYTYQSNRFQSKMAPAPPAPPTKEQIEANRRMYKLPQTQPLYAAPPRINPNLNGGPQPQASDRIYNVRPQQQQSQHYYQDTTGVTPLNMEHSNRFGLQDPMTLKNNYIDEDSYKSPPQQDVMSSGDAKLEPVVTLQMIQTKKGGQGSKLSTLHADIPKNGIPSGPPVNGTEKPVYVVYPIREKPVDHVVVGHRGDNGPPPPPPPPKELPVTSGAYQNTPFTVIHHEQQPILTTLQKHLSVPKSPNRTNFPYQLEQPDPNSASELDSKTRRKDNYYPGQDSIYNIGEQPVSQQPQQQPKILHRPPVEPISAKLPLVTERPAIAIAYTPTTKVPQTAQHQQQGGYYNHYSMPNYDSAVIPEILDNFQSTPFKKDELDVAYPIGGGGVNVGGDYYQKDFQAPFHPSVNLGTISDSYQGWSILDRTTKRTPPEGEKPQSLQQQKNNNGLTNEIDRKDKNKDELIIGDYTSDSKDPMAQEGGFHPELEGGFVPIVPAHLMGVDHHAMAMKLDEDFPVAEKQTAKRPHEFVMAKDTMADISAEEQEHHVGNMRPMTASMVVGHHEEEPKEEMQMEKKPMETEKEKEEEQEQEQEEEEDDEQPQRMQEPERKPTSAPTAAAPPAPAVDGLSSTTEKIMSLGDALSAIFGLDDEGFEEMTTKSQFNEIERSSS